MEAEFVAAPQVVCELLGIKELIDELDTGGRHEWNSEHIDVRFKFVKDFSKKEVIAFKYCESKMMRANILTKALPAPRLEALRQLLMVEERPPEKEC
ncbi:hypothetical protein PF005_g13340 [Phytophthora fragariae]|uniref:Reverse transcriptase Ty1/copia-type domain-containing protein n=3 Tax=Phytophthora TaxID=4783 RepID=A0A6A3L3U6_9STRA|nr:hypothetical protein PF011_g8784 [Phytophthora fragariae]KAE9205602.1 hypothetical protein PF005_g13340 [Phytophthora fragariae]KAE9220365.1 hypothetical protein PF002_g15918 [Phytophthora fragariae]